MKNSVFILGLMSGVAFAGNVCAATCPDGTCSSDLTCTCNDNGQVTESVNNKTGNDMRKNIYTYDANGKKTSSTQYKDADNIANNTPAYKYIYTYDANGKITSSTEYEGADNIANNTPTFQSRNIYDSNGYETCLTEYKGTDNIANNTPTRQYRYTYDTNGNRTSSTIYTGANHILNNIPDTQYRYLGMPNEKTIFDYQGADNITSNTPYRQRYYLYDNNGNLVSSQTKTGANMDSAPSLICAAGYFDGCEGYTQEAATFNYASAEVLDTIICVTGYVAGCVSTPTNNGNSTGIVSGGGTGGSSAGSGKRIYTIEEARQAVEAAGTDTVNFRIRYK